MNYRLVNARYIRDYIIELYFNDGTQGEVDFANELYGEVFEPLKDISKFKSFHLMPEINTIIWETGADFAPEFLYESARRAGEQKAGFDARVRSRKSA